MFIVVDSNFGDIFDVKHFIDSLRDEVHIIEQLPEKLGPRDSDIIILEMSPVSWSDEKYYLHQVYNSSWYVLVFMVTYSLYLLDNLSPVQILPLFSKYSVIHFNKTDARLANNGISTEIQLLRCRVNFHALKFTPQIEGLGNELVHKLRAKGSFVALHLRYEMDMLAFSGCNHGLSPEEAEELKKMRFVANPMLPSLVT
jgi:rhamnogalacturonan I rhamnosyltransferase